MAKAAAPLPVTGAQRTELERMARSASLPSRVVNQARALLLAAGGLANEEIARRCGVDSDTVRRWRRRFSETGVEGVGVIAEGRGRKPATGTGNPRIRRPAGPRGQDPRVARTAAAVFEAVREILVQEGWDAATHLRVAERSGVHQATIWRHWSDRSALLHATIADLLAAEATVEAIPTADLRQDLLTTLDRMRHVFFDKNYARLIAALIDRSEWNPSMHRLKLTIAENAFRHTQRYLEAAVDRGDLKPDLDVDLAVDQLVGPIVYRRLMSGRPVSHATIATLVDDLLAVHGTQPLANPGATVPFRHLRQPHTSR